ncbi:MAG: hypothetical protein A2Y38_24635 [Spirochaetes bacterium GWB1_59_5]|nr:MAG: hypothetical protein A2Y38_24635 [Spirochaetes bacterium GWB1_59_5]
MGRRLSYVPKRAKRARPARLEGPMNPDRPAHPERIVCAACGRRAYVLRGRKSKGGTLWIGKVRMVAHYTPARVESRRTVCHG